MNYKDTIEFKLYIKLLQKFRKNLKTPINKKCLIHTYKSKRQEQHAKMVYIQRIHKLSKKAFKSMENKLGIKK